MFYYLFIIQAIFNPQVFYQCMKINSTAPIKTVFCSNILADDPIKPSSASVHPSSEIFQLPKINASNQSLGILKRHVANSRIAMLHPITSKQDYDLALNKLYNTTYYACGGYRDFFDDSGYENVEDELKALALYCGLNDKSFLINSWLSGRKKDDMYKTLSDEEIANGLRAFEYSLKELDKRFGTFEGTVYRRGFFNPITDWQYYSTSDKLPCANAFCHKKNAQEFKPFSIIRIKKGHRIFDFQKYANSTVSNNFDKLEHEVLLDRNSRFRKLRPEEYTKQDIKDIKYVLKKQYGYKPWQLNFDKLDKQFDFYNKFMVWEEI